MTQPPHGPQWPAHGPGGHGYPPPPQPPRRAARWPVVAASVSGVALLVVSLVVVITLTSGNDQRSTDTGYHGFPGATTGGPPPPTTTESPTSTTRETTTERTTTAVTEPSQEREPRKILKLADHPLLQDPDAGLQNLVCELPPWRTDQAAAEAFFTAARQCLDAAWGPLLEHYNLPFTPPTLHFPTGDGFSTECGNIQVGIATAAYYCENSLYVPFAGLQTDQYGDNPGVYLALFAHEYGHHVQEVAGIMDAAWEEIYAAGQDSEAGLEMSRRKELQAQCFSGMFLGAHVDRGGTITRDMYDKAWQDQETRGDDTSGTRDHGSNAHYADWWRAGAVDNRIADCNTFAASSADVS
ncbi:neutral zinc metallopeptidase [Qaidamihabitans albus]|uniref:neutral zinc metallopeptidase n=1 Tax=Qaidamihabitans albus TaxID=2795733 RepID=UPI0018F15FCD|nr:neutral zinc metallopeptidase [Qaidamihabitans albus]